MKRILIIVSLLLIGCSKDDLFVNITDDLDNQKEFVIYPSSFEIQELNNGYYSYHTTILPDDGIISVALAYVDFNKDGYVDILGKDEKQPNVLKLYTNDGNDNYFVSLIKTENESISTKSGPRKISVVDINNDGNLDIICSLAPDDETSKRGLYILENKGNLFYEHTILNGRYDWIHTATAADVNRDGYVDIFVGGKGYILMGNGDFTFTQKDLPRNMTHEDPFQPGQYNSMGISQEMIDINGDGWVDILMGYHLNNVDYVGQDYANSHVIHYGTGDERMFTEAYILNSNYQGTNITLDFSVMDFDNDGDLDLFVNSNFNYQSKYVIQYYENNGYMNFTNKTSDVFENESNLVESYYDIDWIKSIDRTNDGVKELMIEGVNSKVINGQYVNPEFNGFQLNENKKFVRRLLK